MACAPPNQQALPGVTFLIPTLNSALTITRCLESIFLSDYDPKSITVWILDGLSTDDTAGLAMRHNVRLIRIKGNPAVAYNSVLNQISTPLVALVDSDACVDPAWLKTLVRTLERGDADAAGGRILGAGPETPLAKAIGDELDWRYSALPKRVERIATTCMVIRTEALRRIGGFDPRLATGYDAAMGYALNRIGGKILFVPSAVVRHFHRSSLKGYALQQFRYGKDSIRLVRSWPRAVAGDSVTPAWMTLQPFLLGIVMACLFALLLGLAPAAPLLILVAGGVSLLALLWLAVAIGVFVNARDVRSFVLMPVVQLVRAAAWSAGIISGAASELLGRWTKQFDGGSG